VAVDTVVEWVEAEWAAEWAEARATAVADTVAADMVTHLEASPLGGKCHSRSIHDCTLV